MEVRAKKYLGQHFLKDQSIAKRIAESLTFHEQYDALLEIGPGTGVLTTYLLDFKLQNLTLLELDKESVDYLHKKIPASSHIKILYADFLKINLKELFSTPFGVIGNFPYNISSQIMFRVLEYRHQIPEVVGMFQKEVAERICSNEGSKVYGILSVLVGAFYDREILFNVSASVFIPPPKVESAVLRLKRKDNIALECDEKLFFRVVKQAFQTRRKTLRNALKPINLPQGFNQESILDKRAEQLTIPQFIELTKKIEILGKSEPT